MNTGEFPLRELVIAIGGNRGPLESRADWLRRVAKAAGLHPRAVRAVWERDPNISFKTARRLKETAKNNAQFENADTALRFERIADALEAADPEFHRQEIDAYLDIARRIRALAEGEE